MPDQQHAEQDRIDSNFYTMAEQFACFLHQCNNGASTDSPLREAVYFFPARYFNMTQPNSIGPSITRNVGVAQPDEHTAGLKKRIESFKSDASGQVRFSELVKNEQLSNFLHMAICCSAEDPAQTEKIAHFLMGRGAVQVNELPDALRVSANALKEQGGFHEINACMDKLLQTSRYFFSENPEKTLAKLLCLNDALNDARMECEIDIEIVNSEQKSESNLPLIITDVQAELNSKTGVNQIKTSLLDRKIDFPKSDFPKSGFDYASLALVHNNQRQRETSDNVKSATTDQDQRVSSRVHEDDLESLNEFVLALQKFETKQPRRQESPITDRTTRHPIKKTTNEESRNIDLGMANDREEQEQIQVNLSYFDLPVNWLLDPEPNFVSPTPYKNNGIENTDVGLDASQSGLPKIYLTQTNNLMNPSDKDNLRQDESSSQIYSRPIIKSKPHGTAMKNNSVPESLYRDSVFSFGTYWKKNTKESA